MKFGPIKPGKPLLDQLEESNIEFDQLLQTALEVSASKPDVSPEDIGFPDSYLTLALYRLNSILSRIVELDQTRYNIFHEYLRTPKCYPREVVPGNRLSSVLNTAIELAQDGNTIGVGLVSLCGGEGWCESCLAWIASGEIIPRPNQR